MRAFLNKYLPLMFIIIFPLFFIRQGLDFTDTGFMLTNYQQIFNHPTSIETSFRLWLTNVLGGIWIYFFGDSLGFIGYRIAAVSLAYAIAFFSYLTLKPYIKQQYLLWGIFISVMFINRSGYQFNYNSFTAFFYVLAAYFIVKGLQKEKNSLVFLSAFILGLNIFIRLPNVLGFSMILCVFFHGYISKISVSDQIKRGLYFLTGYLFSIVLIFFIMYLTGQLESYISGFKNAFLMLDDPQGYHSTGYLTRVIVDLYKTTLSKLGFAILYLSFIVVSLSVAWKLRSKAIQYGIIAIATLAWLYCYHDTYQNWYALIGSVSGVLYVFLIIILFKMKKSSGLYLASFAALIICIIAPLGSANGFVNAVYGMYLPIPIVFGYIAEICEVKINLKESRDGVSNNYYIRLKENELRLIKVITLIILVIFTVRSAYIFTYRDAGDRMAMAYRVNHPMLKGVLTTKERARVVEELLDVLPRYVKEDDYLLAYEQTSLVYFLTNTRPYLYGSWPMLYNPNTFRLALNRAVQERPYLPVMVRATGNTEEFSWPKTKGLRPSVYFNEIREIMNNFISENNYRVVWENSFFEILLPRDSGYDASTIEEKRN